MAETKESKAAGEAAGKTSADAANAAKDAFSMGGAPNAQSMMGMDPSKLSETFRAMTQQSMEQSKQAYARMKSAADDATRTLESTMENAHQGSLQLSKKAIEAMRANAEMGFSHLDRMMSAKSVAEMIEMQTSYVRKQVEMATDQAKEMQSLSQSVARELMKPGREAFEKAASQVKTS